MSSSNKESNSNFDQEKFKQYGKRFEYYFDIFYRVMKGLVGLLILLLLVGGALAGGTVIGYFASLVEDAPMPTHAQMQSQIYDYNVKSTLYYADNSMISDVQSDLLRTPVPLEDISPLVIQGVIATEDENFFIHEGIVPKALIRAGVQELSGAPLVTGGSTLTQQLVKQQILSAEVTHSRKAVEILYATHLENAVDKEEILEAYLNVSPFGRNNFGQNIAGIEEAAQGIFGVSPAELNLPQAAFLAGLPKSPISYSPYNQYGEIKEDVSAGIYRQQEVLYSMYREGYIDRETHQEALNYDITADFLARDNENITNPAQSYVYDLVRREAVNVLAKRLMQVDGLSEERIQEILQESRTVPEITEEDSEERKAEKTQLANEINENLDLQNAYMAEADNELVNGGYDVYSTIDPTLHRAVNQKINETQGAFGQEQPYTWKDANGVTHTTQEKYPVQVGGTLIENETGKVLAFVGGRDYEINQANNAFDSRRLSGSVLKPLVVYGPALAEGIVTPATIIPDMKWVLEQPGSRPHDVTNIRETTNQWRDVRHWLTVSQNIPASRLYVQMINDHVDIAQYARSMGFGPEAIGDIEFSRPSTALGGLLRGPTATEIAGAYAAIGNGGVFNSPYIIDRIENTDGEVIYAHEPDPVRVWSEEVNYMLYDILREVTGPIGTGRMVSNYMDFEVDLASKTGTSDNDYDVWYAGVTPNVSLTTWMGYDRQIRLLDYGGLRPSFRNLRNWANIMNVVHDVKPEVLGLNETVPEPDGITSESVLVGTGMKAGEVDLPNGDTIRVGGETKTEIFSEDNVPETTTYDFAQGATEEELEEFWSSRRGRRRRRPSRSNEDENDEQEDEDKDNDEDNEDEEDSSDEKDNEENDENED